MGKLFTLILAVIAVMPMLFICCAAVPDIYITEFEVTPSPVVQGDSAALRWNVTGASEVSLDNGIGLVPASGKVDIRPGRTITYALTARNSGKSLQKSLTVEVNQRPAVSAPAEAQIPVIQAVDTVALLSNAGKEALVEGNITYVSSWLPTRFRGSGTGPLTFIFFMKDVLEGSANNPGVGEYCPECWHDYTSYFRAIIRPECVYAVLPALSAIYGGNFYINSQGLIISAATDGRLIITPSPFWSAGYIITDPTIIQVRGVIENYLSAPVIYLTSPSQISAVRR